MQCTDHRRRIADIREGRDTAAARAWKFFNVLMEDAGFRNREDRLDACRLVTGDDGIESTTDLTDEQITCINSALKQWKSLDKLRMDTGAAIVDAIIVTKMLDESIPATDVIDKQVRRVLTAGERKKLMAKAPKLGEGKKVDVESIINDINKSAGAKVRELSVHEHPDENGEYSFGRMGLDECIPSASPSFGVITETGGMPKGSVIQAWGEPGCGKSMWSLNEIVSQQKQGRPCFLLNLERSYNPKLASQIGIDLEELTVIDVANLEAAGNVLKMLAKEDVFIVLDSVASAVSQHEIDRDMESSNAKLGGTSAEWTSLITAFRMIQDKSTLFLINQVRANLKAGPYSNPNKPYGPVAVQHQIDVSMFCTKAQPGATFLKNDGWVQMNMKFVKNRWSDASGRKVSVVYRPGYAFSKSFDLFEVAKMDMKLGGKTRGEWSNTILPDHQYENGEVDAKKNHFTFMFADDELKAALTQDCEANGESVPEGDGLSIYNFKPALKWLGDHPTYRNVVEDRLLDTTNQDYIDIMAEKDKFQ